VAVWPFDRMSIDLPLVDTCGGRRSQLSVCQSKRMFARMIQKVYVIETMTERYFWEHISEMRVQSVTQCKRGR
jgi:hypothetical protein